MVALQTTGPTVERTNPLGRSAELGLVAALDLAAKGTLLCLLLLVLVEPSWGNLEGKAPVMRAITYPLFAFAVPLVWVLRGRRGSFPWLADLLITLMCFSDILGNRLDLYDEIVWFDDWMHFMNTALLSTAFVVLTMTRRKSSIEIMEGAVSVGLTAALAWELFEYVSFLTRSAEWPTAYSDTLGDLILGWLGSMVAGAVLAIVWRDHGVRRPLHRA